MRKTTPHDEAAAAMRHYGDDLLAEFVEDVAVQHHVDEDSWQCVGCLGEWPCPVWIKSNERVLRWLLSKVAQGSPNGGA